MARNLNWPKNWSKNEKLKTEKSGHKYNAQSNVYNGRKYRSRLEASKAMELDWLLKAGEITGWEYEPKPVWQIYVNDFHICQYCIDFKVYQNNGTIDYIETKGVETRDFQLVWKLTIALFDDLTPGENARLFLSKGGRDKLVKQSFKKEC